MSFFLEPSVLSFDPIRVVYSGKPGVVDEFDIFKKFIANLEEVLHKMQSKKARILVSKEYWISINQKIPIGIYNSDSRYSIAKELYTVRLHRFVKRIHSFGDHNREATYPSGSFVEESLRDDETYLYFLDLLLANVTDYPRTILTTPIVRIFLSNDVTLADGLRYEIHNKIDSLVECPEFAQYELKTNTKDIELSQSEIPCHGTGTHDSMWGIKIEALSDVPSAERKLLSNLLKLKIVTKITFLDFDKKSTATDSPYIKILQVEEGTESDNMHCILYGKGEKQNCQKVSIQVKKGFGAKIAKASGDSLTTSFIERLIQ